MNPETILKLSEEVRNLRDNLNDTNLLDAVYVDENTHSCILKMILSYSVDGEYPFFESFLKIDKVARILPNGFQGGKPHFFNERDRIDLLIEGKDYAIIIENKVYGAVDQNRQLERYLDVCMERGMAPEKLYALYLTKDGSKKVAEGSLTAKAMEVLGISSETQGRFAEINFKEDILRWLRESILLCEGKDYTQIKSAIIQYTDYVLGMFGEDENTSRFQEGLTGLLVKYDIRTVGAFSEYIDAGNILSAELTKKRDELCRYLGNRFIASPLREYCVKTGVELCHEEYSFKHIGLRISIPGMEKASFCFNTESDGRNIYGLCNYSVIDKEALSEHHQSKFQDAGYVKTDWWPAWRSPDPVFKKYERPASAGFWEGCVQNKSFADYVIAVYEDVVKLLEQ